MKLKPLVLAQLFCAATPAALAAGFDGAFVQLGIGLANGQTAFSSYWDLPPNVDTRASHSGRAGQLAAGYSKSLEAWNLGASVFYAVGDLKMGSIHLDAGPSVTERYDFKGQHAWGIVIEPGYRVGDSTLVYLKLGYSQIAGKTVNLFNDVSYHYDATYKGMVYGVGAKTQLTPQIYGVAELIEANYKRQDFRYPDGGLSIKPSAWTGLIGLGYRF